MKVLKIIGFILFIFCMNIPVDVLLSFTFSRLTSLILTLVWALPIGILAWYMFLRKD